jgi:hypothetical protein
LPNATNRPNKTATGAVLLLTLKEKHREQLHPQLPRGVALHAQVPQAPCCLARNAQGDVLRVINELRLELAKWHMRNLRTDCPEWLFRKQLFKINALESITRRASASAN